MQLSLSWTTIIMLLTIGFMIGWVTGKSLWPWVIDKIKSVYARVRGN